MMAKKMAKKTMLREEMQIQKALQPTTKMKASLGWMCFYTHGLVLTLLLLRQQFSRLVQAQLLVGSPLGLRLMRATKNILITDGDLGCRAEVETVAAGTCCA